MNEESESLDDFKLLLGSWRGRGVASFPTIETAEYTEELSFTLAAAHELIGYVQAATLTSGEPTHWETGLIMPAADGQFEWRNAQNSGRGEVLLGRVLQADRHHLRLEFESTGFSSDERMIRTRREISIEGDRLVYEVSMATTTTEEPQLLGHLKAELTRIQA